MKKGRRDFSSLLFRGGGEEEDPSSSRVHTSFLHLQRARAMLVDQGMGWSTRRTRAGRLRRCGRTPPCWRTGARRIGRPSPHRLPGSEGCLASGGRERFLKEVMQRMRGPPPSEETRSKVHPSPWSHSAWRGSRASLIRIQRGERKHTNTKLWNDTMLPHTPTHLLPPDRTRHAQGHSCSRTPPRRTTPTRLPQGRQQANQAARERTSARLPSGPAATRRGHAPLTSLKPSTERSG